MTGERPGPHSPLPLETECGCHPGTQGLCRHTHPASPPWLRRLCAVYSRYSGGLSPRSRPRIPVDDDTASADSSPLPTPPPNLASCHHLSSKPPELRLSHSTELKDRIWPWQLSFLSSGFAASPLWGSDFSCLEHRLQGTWGLSLPPPACGILVPISGIEPTTPALEYRFLTTGPAGRSQWKLF